MLFKFKYFLVRKAKKVQIAFFVSKDDFINYCEILNFKGYSILNENEADFKRKYFYFWKFEIFSLEKHDHKTLINLV